jgi:Ca2+-binding RTX toxin-like protein
MSLTATSSPSSGFSGNASAAYSSFPGGRDLMNFSGMQQLRITGTPSADYLVVTSGSGSGSVTLDAGNGNNTLLGGAGSRDLLVGGTGNDSIAGTGNDTLRGGGGTNTYVVSSTSNLISDEGTGSVILSSVPFSLASSLVSGVHSLVYTGLSPAMLTGSVQSDSLRVRMGNDTLSGCPAGPNPGRGQIDTLTGGSGADLYVLGTKAGGAFYRSGGSPGNQDYAQITAFTVSQDRLQLAGKKSDYVLGASGVGGLSGQGLFLDLNHNGKIDPSDDLIAVLQSGNANALTSANTVGKALFV